MTKVILSKRGAKEFAKLINIFTEEDKISLRYWISFVEKWAGYHAASFGFSARVIYRIVDLKIEIVEIERITTIHDYRR